jgi:hypothetical protein
MTAARVFQPSNPGKVDNVLSRCSDSWGISEVLGLGEHELLARRRFGRARFD